MMSIAVIGAGGAGLCCARHLSGSPDVLSFSVFEKADQIGGTWIYTDLTDKDKYGLPVHSSIYRGLKTNLPKELMPFPDFPFKEELPSFIRHDDMLEYLQLYTEEFGLQKHIQFHTLVEKVEPVLLERKGETTSSCSPSGFQDTVNWMLTTKDLKTGQISEAIYNAVIVCSGHYSVPHLPDIPGLSHFPGQVIHSHCYRIPDIFSGKKVLIVGARASGTDIMVEVAAYAHSVCLVYRNKNRVEYKLPPNVEQLPSIVAVGSDGTICFENEESRVIDDIILCTGYQYSFPFLTNESGIRVESGKRIAPLYKHIFNILHPSMAFVGLNYPVVPFPSFNIQVQFIISVLVGKTQLPSQEEMMKDCEEDYSRQLEQGLPHHHAHKVKKMFSFLEELAQMAGLEPLAPKYSKLNAICMMQRKYNAINYKKYNYTVCENSNGEITITRSLCAGETLVHL